MAIERKVIPFFPRGKDDARTDAHDSDAMRDLALARRRGFDTEEVPRPAAARPSAAAPAAATTPTSIAATAATTTNAAPAPAAPATISGAPLGASLLSTAFIESLDDMMRGAPATGAIGRWPPYRDEGLERVAADIVDMLFSFVLDHPQVPGGLRQALARAQLPILRMAMQETAFFADWQHPARRFLNAIAPTVQEVHARHGDTTLFERRFVAALDRILDELAPNGAAFAALLDTLDQLREEVPAAGPSDETAAWERAEAVSREILARPLPQLARDFVADYWIDVLQRTALAHAEESPQWRDAVQVVEDLAWSLAPRQDHDGRLRLIGLLPSLLGRLNRGLDVIGVSRDERRPFFDALVEAHAVVLRAEATAPARVAESAIDQVLRLQRGDWVEFQLADGSSNRARLTWISPKRGLLVFSNHQGDRAIQIAPDELADQVANRRATLIFDHAEAGTGKQSA